MAINVYLFHLSAWRIRSKGVKYEHNKNYRWSGGILDLDCGFTVDRKHQLAE
jgi:hypothetical protein